MIAKYLPPKLDVILFVALTQPQQQLYLDAVAEGRRAFDGTHASAFQTVNVLKKIANDPARALEAAAAAAAAKPPPTTPTAPPTAQPAPPPSLPGAPPAQPPPTPPTQPAMAAAPLAPPKPKAAGGAAASLAMNAKLAALLQLLLASRKVLSLHLPPSPLPPSHLPLPSLVPASVRV